VFVCICIVPTRWPERDGRVAADIAPSFESDAIPSDPSASIYLSCTFASLSMNPCFSIYIPGGQNVTGVLQLMLRRRLKAMPICDDSHHVRGVVSLSDILRVSK
jgi:CBS domain containing-hemolysin-like protein